MAANNRSIRQSGFPNISRFAHYSVALVFLVMVAASWRRWTTPIVDTGREMDLPRRLLEGELLYRDVHYIYAPLSPYINALLYSVFGLHHDVLIFTGLAGAALIALLCYRIAGRLLAAPLASVAVLLILVMCVFRLYGNLIAPYSYAALHGAVCALASLLCALRYAGRGRWVDLLGAGALVGLAGITKLEFALPAAAAVIAATFALHHKDVRTFALRLGSAGLIGAAIGLPLYGWWFFKLGWRTLIVDCHLLLTHLPPSLVYYNSWRSGADHPWRSLAAMFGSAAVWVLIAAVILLCCVIRNRTKPLVPNVRNATLAIIAAMAVIFAAAIGAGGWDGSPMRAIPFALLAVIVREVWKIRRKTPDDPRSAALLVIAVFSLTMLVRVVMRVPSSGPYGGFILPTAYIFGFYLLVAELPRIIERLTQDKTNLATARTLATGAVLLLILIAGGNTLVRFRTKFVGEVATPRGHFLVERPHDPAYIEAIDFLQKHSAPGDAIAVLPEGSDLAFLTGRRMPLRHQILLPGLMSEADELRAIEQLASLPVRYVFITNRPTREFGAAVWGRDYYQRLDAAIRSDYRVVKVCGRNRDPEIEIGDREYFIKILERK
ncbi:MAG: glycosyltransferase family 39 protein [Acidobacteria bacterium]|nr:glycosyltransferase family 39 protein [Acidobacteriota bacterium]MCW5968016.1 glycosyltransferase family 39 protein [Blastocatellales bacterium]